MIDLLKRAINSVLYPFGYWFRKTCHPTVKQDRDAVEIIGFVHPDYTVTGVERLYALIEAVRYMAGNGIDGDFVECGVWKGGSSMALAAVSCGISPNIWLFDTFEGMTEPTDADIDLHGKSAKRLQEEYGPGWMRASEEDVRRNLNLVGYIADKWVLVKGPVEETIPANIPQPIAILRLDTDWYESTRHEMEHLYDRLVPRGVLIIDDYDEFHGCRKAVDEFFTSRGINPYLVPVDGHRIHVKQ